MERFTKMPNEVLTDRRISPAARITYACLAGLAWRRGRRSESDAVELPPLDVIADEVGCSRTALKGYVAELRKEGLVVTVRRGSRAMSYFVFDSPCRSESDLVERTSRSESDPLVGRIPTRSRARLNREKKETAKRDANASMRAPKLERVGGRDLALDALADSCNVSLDGGRVGELVTALNGRGANVGIRDQFWRELVLWAEANDRLDALGEACGERFERALVRRIAEKCELYRTRMPNGTILTPAALRKWWVDLDRATTTENAAMSPSEIQSYLDRS